MLRICGYLILSIMTVPILLSGFKVFGTSKRAHGICAVAMLALELFRFFYTASLYEQGAAAMDALSFSALTVLMVFAFFAVYANDKYKNVFARLYLSCLMLPLIFALFYPATYHNVRDTYAVLAGLYFLQMGIAFTLGIMLFVKMRSFTAGDMVLGLFAAGCIMLVPLLTNLVWHTQMFFPQDIALCLALLIISFATTAVPYLGVRACENLRRRASNVL